MKRSLGDTLFTILNSAFMVFLCVVTLYPFLNVLAISLNDPLDTVKGGLTVYPRMFTFANYEDIFQTKTLLSSVMISVLRTVIGTAVGIFSTAMLAFVLSRKDFFAIKPVTILFLITMYVSGGLIPEYILIRDLRLFKNFAVYILPGLISVFNVIVFRAFITDLPYELQESAKIDGANDMRIFFTVVIPLCIPVIATLSLFIAVGQWNSWFDTYLYCRMDKRLYTLQYELQLKLLSAQSSGTQNIYGSSDLLAQHRVSPESIRMAMTIVATVPILLVYPFIQKYFMKGLTLGAVKA